jgi:hypothetical protein
LYLLGDWRLAEDSFVAQGKREKLRKNGKDLTRQPLTQGPLGACEEMGTSTGLVLKKDFWQIPFSGGEIGLAMVR